MACQIWDKQAGTQANLLLVWAVQLSEKAKEQEGEMSSQHTWSCLKVNSLT